MLNWILLIFSFFQTANIFASESDYRKLSYWDSNLYKACMQGSTHYLEADMKFRKDMHTKKISPHALLQALANNLYIYSSFERELERRSSCNFLDHRFFRANALKKDIKHIEEVFKLSAPEPNEKAKNFGNSFAKYEDKKLPVAFHSLYLRLPSVWNFEDDITEWLRNHRKPQGATNFYIFDFSDKGQTYNQRKNDILETYKSIELDGYESLDVRILASGILKNVIDAHESIYTSPYVLEHKKEESTYTREICIGVACTLVFVGTMLL